MIPQFAPGRESAHRGLPFIRILFCVGQLGDVERGIAERDQRFPVCKWMSSLNDDQVSATIVFIFRESLLAEQAQ
jgi:hypothetical protein